MEDPNYQYWKIFQKGASSAYKKWFEYWIAEAEKTDKMIYFFRFEDVLRDPENELRNLFKFILGMETLEGTVIE